VANNILEMRNITKTFPGVKALQDVTLDVARGEVHAICGENGAGKSTLMKVLSGVYGFGTYEGDIVFEAETVQFRDIRDSEAKGIVIIHQELALSPFLSIAENIFLNNEIKGFGGLIDWTKTNVEASKLLARVGLRENPTTKVRDIGVGKQQAGQAAHSGRAHRSPERRGLGPPARPDPEPQRPGHHVDHHQSQAERDQEDLRHRDGDSRRKGDRDHRQG
jgi:putative multiple sugar transport system ATP-binding protein